MQINTNNMISMTDANQNFSRVARFVDENGCAVIFKNNAPRYVLLEFSRFQGEEVASDEDVKSIGTRILRRNLEAFRELAK